MLPSPGKRQLVDTPFILPFAFGLTFHFFTIVLRAAACGQHTLRFPTALPLIPVIKQYNTFFLPWLTQASIPDSLTNCSLGKGQDCPNGRKMSAGIPNYLGKVTEEKHISEDLSRVLHPQMLPNVHHLQTRCHSKARARP